MHNFVDRASLRKMLQNPEGCVGITAVRAEGEPRRLLEEIVGRHVYLLDYEPDALRLTHSTPGSGTWAARLPLGGVPAGAELELIIAWSPNELRLSAVDPDDRSRGRVAVGELMADRVLVDDEGGLLHVGTMARGMRLYVNGKTIASPPAIDLWQDTREAVRVLLTGTSSEGFLHEVVTANAALSMLVTGLETYCQERFVEIEGEGVPVDAVAFLKRFGSTEERAEVSAGRLPEAAQPPGDRLDRAASLVRRVNFQNFEHLKRAFNKAYGIRLGVDLDSKSQVLERVQTLLRFRHRIVHVSPMITILNQGPGVSDEEWEWAGKPLAEAASEEMDEFVRALHSATLRLRSTRPEGATS